MLIFVCKLSAGSVNIFSATSPEVDDESTAVKVIFKSSQFIVTCIQESLVINRIVLDAFDLLGTIEAKSANSLASIISSLKLLKTMY